MGVAKNDYMLLEREYISTDISIRELCKKHGIKSYSSVAQYAREHGWYEKRSNIRDKALEKTAEKLAERISDENVDITTEFRSESITVIRAAFRKYAEQLLDPQYRIRTDELAKLVQIGLLVVGQPTERIEERKLDLHANIDGLPEDILRRLVEATRPRTVVGRTEADLPRAAAQEALKH